MKNKTGTWIAAVLFLGLCQAVCVSHCFANGLSITNTKVNWIDVEKEVVVIKFDLAWQNSWRNETNHDAAWVFVKVAINDGTPVHGILTGTGINPPGCHTNDDSFEVYVPQDKKGAFVRRKVNASPSAVELSKVYLRVDANATGIVEDDEIDIYVFGIEMVYIPEGSFYAGDGAAAAGFLQQPAGVSPWLITGEGAINTGDGMHYYTAVGDGNPEYASGQAFTIPADYPKGYGPFYCMKYELSEGLWTAFFNTLSPAQKANRNIADADGKAANTVVKRNTFYWAGSNSGGSSSRPNRATGWLSWPDLCAFLDWAALRPMTELEFEKIARGTQASLAGEYAWGTTDLIQAQALSAGAESGATTVTTVGANAVYGSVVFSGGDSQVGAEYAQGPLRSGIFATSASDRESAGAAVYGVMDLSGNIDERVVTLGNSTGIAFTGLHGDGVLTSVTDHEGNADVSGWPGFNATVAYGITEADGSGLRGGGWDSAATRLEISDRAYSVNLLGRTSSSGGRGVRTDDEE